MTHLAKGNDSDANSWSEFKKKNNIKFNIKFAIKFQNGYCISLDTTNKKIIDWAKSRGLHE